MDWNLVSLRPGRPSRYRVLETIRQYTMELRGADVDALRRAHLDWSERAVDRLLATAPGDERSASPPTLIPKTLPAPMPDDEGAISATVPRRAAGKWAYPAYGEAPRRTPRAEQRVLQTSARAGKNEAEKE